MEYSLENLQMAYQSSLKGGNLLEFKDLKVGMKIKVILTGSVETINKIDYKYNMIETEKAMHWEYGFGKYFEFYVPKFEGPSDAITHLKSDDYTSLLDLAVELDNKPWFDEICATINELKVGEQHA